MRLAIGLFVGSRGPVNLAPSSCAIANPAPAFTATQGATLTVDGTAADPNGNLASVKVYVTVNGGPSTLWGTATGTTSWTFDHVLAAVDVGAVVITARATDTGGLTIDSATVTGTVIPDWGALWVADA